MKISCLFLVLLLPVLARADVVINEIAYDIEGSDTDREWIEIWNNGSESIDLSSWKLNEADTNHALKILQGSPLIAPDAFAVIADNAERFLADNPGFSGSLFDSSFSLSNTGENLVLKDAELTLRDQISYSSDFGAKGDGNTLSRTGSSWSAVSPTPGAANSSTPVVAENSNNTSSSSSQNTNSGTTPESSGVSTLNASSPDAKKIYARSGGDRVTVVGAPMLFEGQAVGLEGEPLPNARFVWNLGDGAFREGRSFFYTYAYPGEYIVILDVSSSEWQASDRLTVKVISSPLSISRVSTGADGFVEIKNGGSLDLDISFWILKDGSHSFIFPKNTLIGKGKTIIFSASVTDLVISSSSLVGLFYPNDKPAFSYSGAEEEISISQKIESKEVSKISSGNEVRSKTVLDKAVKEAAHKESVAVKEEIEKGQTALALEATDKESGGFSKWLFALFAIILVAVFGVIFSKPKSKIKSEDEVEADQFTIIEE
ncbi:MAG: hypothetical protein A2836_02105 [Candidatus Taylorbacteria bacterium RIFCSPHIGHO2_01_FULL_45_63]|uniref:PKD domain-containing protein n=1 Tax=Candidatus Taylorbacteria bacterium RIFCSPHIGHO2_02_FULL_45_35 TaxID=1802311 RepID=A0A1G2MWD8_9BACT|nr:MAG: hypothetical protein A2836_02105 [Candidatus Taylorbacteria bacterium RIFCSPHIGHO2_01_FULL_45_63]OHA27402.1 MAG: hypothetical protein A3D56_03870 [Candidatus Taylorbacteria bacterium RIFCSPHIGHO2_02_FULL_45_35]OHA34265.1 MAG: hypothetical protein A3A22_01260 [Candidatus Taylorbacteria bacterium RIFCSPLOWO2_01_FULL_45_34b]